MLLYCLDGPGMLSLRLMALFNAPVPGKFCDRSAVAAPLSRHTMRLLLGRRAMVGPAFWAAAALVAQTPTPPARAAGGPSSLSGKPRPETGVILLEPVVQSGTILALALALALALSTHGSC